MASQVRNLFVLGAGLTHAFLPAAPLITDDYGGADLLEKFRGFPHATRVLDLELSRANAQINIERLMTRLDGRMPYDFDQEANEELGSLFTELKKNFIKRIQAARSGPVCTDELAALARYCVHNHVTCITFNYDDVLDEALWNVCRAYTPIAEPYWHPDGGYGFFCRPSQASVEDTLVQMDVQTSMLLLKLHGSINWYPRRGYPKPYVVDAIMHHEPWWFLETEPNEPTREAITLHIEPEPFIIPPVLLKSALVEQPILRLVWHRAYRALATATHVTFVGYSCPTTDIAAGVLFHEALKTLQPTAIEVVNLAQSKNEKRKVRGAYEAILGPLPDKQFDFRGALDWARDLATPNDANPS